jgi:hypothetical protein
VKLRDDTIEPACCVSSVSLEELFVELGYRPGAQAVRYEAIYILQFYLFAIKYKTTAIIMETMNIIFSL